MPHKLLLADDSVTIQRVIELTFADEDVQVIVVGDGKQAIERVRQDRPDIVLADIGMPERDGYEVAAFIKSDPQYSHIPVVLLTGAFEPLDENRAKSVGCDGVLVKPFEPQMVINRVKELLTTARPASVARVPAVQVSSHMVDELEAALPPPLAPAETHAASGHDALEEYFDRLDAAFANIGTAPPGAPRPQLEPEDLSAGLGELHQPPPERAPATEDPVISWDPAMVEDFGPARQPDLANAFAALLAAEQGEGAPPLAAIVAGPPQRLSEDMIEDIVQRVIARMSDDAVRRTVLETAERLVRAEIDRIKQSAAGNTPHAGR